MIKLNEEGDFIQEIFYELIKEASTGKVLIDGEIWPIGFNTIIYENNKIKLSLFNESNLSTLVIHDENEFINKLEEYLNLEKEKNRKCIKFYQDANKNYLKILIAYLCINATLDDFLDSIRLIERNISFLKDDTFNYLNNGLSFDLSDTLLGSNLEIKNISQSILMETPNKLEFSFTTLDNNSKLVYKLPSITYGICNLNGEKVCYIYSILGENKDKKIDNKLSKKINRILYKLNKGVYENESQEYLDNKGGKSDYYPENISDVSMSSILSLITFITILKKEGIKCIKGVPYLPLRYLSRDIVANNQENETKKELLNTRNDFIQSNITDKFIRTFRRVAYYVPDIEFVSYPYELSEFLEVKLGLDKINSKNQIVDEVQTNISKLSK